MLRKWLGILLLPLVVACHPHSAGSRHSVEQGAADAPIGDSPAPLDEDGTISGGGGLADLYAKESLNIAKGALSKMIANASPELFVKFPADKGQKWLAALIDGVELRQDPKAERYGSPLKFNYDFDSGKLWATQNFVANFPYGRFWTRPAEEQHRILSEVMIDIMHEAAHFYGIGTTEAEDPNAETWAMLVMNTLDQDVLACETEVIDAENKGKSGIYLHRPSGLFQAVTINLPKGPEFLSSTLMDWERKTEFGEFQYLTSPKIFLDTITEAKERSARAKAAMSKLVEISQVKIGTVFDREKDSYYEMLILQRNGGSGWNRKQPLIPQDGNGDFGAPVDEKGRLHYAHSTHYKDQIIDEENQEVWADTETRVFQEFVFDPTTMGAQYSFGVTADESKLTAEQLNSKSSPLFRKSQNFTCKSLVRGPLLLDKFNTANGKTEFVPKDGRDYTEFARAMNKMAKANHVQKVDGKSPNGKACFMNLVYGFLPNPTLALWLSNQEEDQFFFFQTNFHLLGMRLLNPQNKVDYDLTVAEANATQIKVREEAPMDQVHVSSGGIKSERNEVEVTFELDEKGRTKTVRAQSFKAPLINFECTLEHQNYVTTEELEALLTK